MLIPARLHQLLHHFRRHFSEWRAAVELRFHRTNGMSSSIGEEQTWFPGWSWRHNRRSHSRFLVLTYPNGVPVVAPQEHSAWQRRDRVTIDNLFDRSSNVDTEARDHGWKASGRICHEPYNPDTLQPLFVLCHTRVSLLKAAGR